MIRPMLFVALVALGILDLTQMMIIICAEMVGRMLRRLRPVKMPSMPPCRPECSCVIVTWHNRKALEQSLPALVRAVQRSGGNHEVIVVIDHEIGEGTEEYVRRKFPEVKVLASQRSLYFGAATRLGISQATRDIVVLVNNDVIVDENFLSPLIRAFEDPGIFGVSSRVVPSQGGERESGKTVAKLRDGRIAWAHEPVTTEDEKIGHCAVTWLHRGAYAFDRRKFHCLGNLDHIYDPLFFEDADLSLRAWRVGWECLLATRSEVKHQHRSASQERGREFLQTIVQRNAYIFFWRNIDDVHELVSHFLNNTHRRLRRMRELTSGGTEIRAFLGASKRLPRIVATRIRLDRMSIRSAREVLGSPAAARSDATNSEMSGEAI